LPTTNASRPIKSSKHADLGVVLFKTQTKNAYSKNKKVVYLKNKQLRFLNNSEIFLKNETKNLYSKSKEGVEILAQLI